MRREGPGDKDSPQPGASVRATPSDSMDRAGVADQVGARGTGTGVPVLALPRVTQAASPSPTAAIMRRDHDSRPLWTQHLNPASPLRSLGQRTKPRTANMAAKTEPEVPPPEKMSQRGISSFLSSHWVGMLPLGSEHSG